MASSYSTSLKIQLIGGGEQSGVWGTTTNTNWNLIEEAVTGVRTITMANSNYTLSNLNGVSDEARNMVLVVQGTNSAIYQVIAPLVNKYYVVFNNTTGGYAIQIGGATGSVISIPNGVTAQVYCDGTNFYSALTGAAGNFTINGTLTASGVSDLGTLTATTITASTQFSGPGTGLTGTASSLSIGGTAATATALNASNSYTVAGLQVNGAQTTTGNINSQGRLLLANGSASSPSIAWSSDGGVDTGFYWGGDGYTFFTNNGVFSGQIQPGGSLVMVGNVTAYSDERLKKNWGSLGSNFVELLAQIKSGTYERIDSGEKQVGVSAQSLQPLMPEAVQEDQDGKLSVAYGNAALAAAVELAKEIVFLKAEIKKLKGE
jgi:hypothetical protein